MDLSLQEIVLVMIGLVTTAGVPWAFIMERRLARIEARLVNGISQRLDSHSKIIVDLERRIREVEIRCARVLDAYDMGRDGDG